MQPGSESAFPASIEPSEPLREVVDLDTVPASTADALSHPLRRQVLYQLSRREFMVPRDALAEHVVGATEDTGGLTAPPKRQVKVQTPSRSPPETGRGRPRRVRSPEYDGRTDTGGETAPHPLRTGGRRTRSRNAPRRTLHAR